MMDLESNESSSLVVKKTLISDISTFTSSFKEKDFVNLSLFHAKWCEMDMSLLRLVAPFDLIIWSIGQVGLFSPSRPYRDHQILLFLLAFFYKLQPILSGGRRTPLRLSLERVKLLKSIKDKADHLDQIDTLNAFNFLWSSNGITIVIEDTEIDSQFNIFNNSTLTTTTTVTNQTVVHSSASAPAPHNPTTELLTDRIRRIESFLQTNDPFADKAFSKVNMIKLQQITKRYEESKLLSTTTPIRSQKIEVVLDSLVKLVNTHQNGSNYRNEVKKRRDSSSAYSSPLEHIRPPVHQSIRTRLSQSISLLTPAVPTFNSSSDPFRINRPQSVPVSKMRKTSLSSSSSSVASVSTSSSSKSNINSNSKSNNIEISTTTNMPNINFY